MKHTQNLIKYSPELKFNVGTNIPTVLVDESIQSEYKSAIENNNTYWDNFKPNIQRSNVLKAQIERNVTRKVSSG
jgi:hypothetical protein